MQFFGLVGILVAVVLGVWIFFGSGSVLAPGSDSDPADEMPSAVPADVQAHIDSKADLIVLDSPSPQQVITSPLTITGEARGYWFFEATFPVVLTNWDGLIIAQHYATADGEWMTEDFVPFTTKLEFESLYQAGDPDFMRRGTLILQRSNASGLPEHDNALEIPVLFKASETTTYEDSINAAKKAAEQLSN